MTKSGQQKYSLNLYQICFSFYNKYTNNVLIISETKLKVLEKDVYLISTFFIFLERIVMVTRV